MGSLGASDIDSRLEEQLIDGILYAFQEQTQEVCIYISFIYHLGYVGLYDFDVKCILTSCFSKTG